MLKFPRKEKGRTENEMEGKGKEGKERKGKKHREKGKGIGKAWEIGNKESV